MMVAGTAAPAADGSAVGVGAWALALPQALTNSMVKPSRMAIGKNFEFMIVFLSIPLRSFGFGQA
jgi:hypothetical protein